MADSDAAVALLGDPSRGWHDLFTNTVAGIVQRLGEQSCAFLIDPENTEQVSSFSHYEPELCIVLDGSVKVRDRDDREAIVCSAGGIVVIGPYQIHRPSIRSSQAEVLWITVSPDRVRCFLVGGRTSGAEVQLGSFDHFAVNDTKRILESLLLEAESREPHWFAFAKGLLAELVALLARAVVDTAPSEDYYPADYDQLHKARSFIGLHFAEPLTLAMIAEAAGLSRNYLATSFKQRFGLTVFAHLAQIRVRHAMELLLGADTKIQDIAQRVGYSSPYYFSRVFKSITGLSPREFRIRNADSRNLLKNPKIV